MYLKLYLKKNLLPCAYQKRRMCVKLWSSQESKKNSKLKPRKVREKNNRNNKDENRNDKIEKQFLIERINGVRNWCL